MQSTRSDRIVRGAKAGARGSSKRSTLEEQRAALKANVLEVRDWIISGAPSEGKDCIKQLAKSRLAGGKLKEDYSAALGDLADEAEGLVAVAPESHRDEVIEELAEISHDRAQHVALLERAIPDSGNSRRVMKRILKAEFKNDLAVALRVLARLAKARWVAGDKDLFQDSACAILGQSTWSPEVNELFDTVVERAQASRLFYRSEIAYLANNRVRAFIKLAETPSSGIPPEDLLKAMAARVTFADAAANPNDPSSYGAVVEYSLKAGDEAVRQGQPALALNFYDHALAKAGAAKQQLLTPSEITRLRHLAAIAQDEVYKGTITNGEGLSMAREQSELAVTRLVAVRRLYPNPAAFSISDAILRQSFSQSRAAFQTQER